MALTSWLRQTYDVTSYNVIHEEIARALISGRLHSVITTNYDCCLDQALTEMSDRTAGPLTRSTVRVVRKGEVPPAGKVGGCYFKIHGSADDPTGESLVFLLKHESALPPWKRALVRTLVGGRTLFIVGYSGLDFEVCPEIPAAKPARVVWNFLSEDGITPNARLVVERVSGVILVGDMRDLITRTLNSVAALPGPPSVDVEGSLRSIFPERVRLLWRARLLNALSYCAASVGLTTSLLESASDDPPYRIVLMHEYARALHYLGRYKSAALVYEAAVSQARTGGLPAESVCRLLLDASDNWRCYGGFIRANRKLREAEVVIIRYGISDRELLAEAKLKRILLLRRNYQIAALFRARPLMLRIRHQAESLIRDAAEAFLRSGSRFSYQQVRLWADRFDLPPEVTRPPDLYEAPPSRLGYEHLGFPMAQMMVLRDEIDTGRRVADESAAKEVLGKSQLAGRLGLHTEGWKLNYLLLKKFSKYRKPDILKKFLRSFARCEYAPLMRVLLLLIRG